MTAEVYVEGGGGSKELRARCREGFRKLLTDCGLAGRMPKLVACGSRNSVRDDFNTACSQTAGSNFVAMLIDSEDPVDDIEATWTHLADREGWQRPSGAHDEQVLFMTTCMETWIVADRDALAKHYGHNLQQSALPSLQNLESRLRNDVQEALEHATRNCSNDYQKGTRSFEILAQLSPSVLRQHLPSFCRCIRILTEKC